MSKNRQKAGVKSASSQMAAELLSGGGMVTFDAFSGGCASLAQTADTTTLAKLNKRDSSTREKALRELIERCTDENSDTVASTFSKFSAQFDKTIFDCSPTVRHLAMKLVSKQVNVLKKKAEKDLFNILPLIIFASCDPFTPCSSEASNFLSGMFTKEKWNEVMLKLSEKVTKIIFEILNSESTFISESKLMNNDEEDSREERMNRLSEQSYGVLVHFLKGKKSEAAEKIVIHGLMNVKKNGLTRGILNAVSHCNDPVSIISSSSLLDPLLRVFSSCDQYALLPLSIDLILLYLSPTSFPLTEKERRKVVNALFILIKKSTAREWDALGVRLLPLFSSLCSLMDESYRATFISEWFNALQSNGIPTKECILYVSDCIKYVLALLDSPSPDETSTALSMVFFTVSKSSSSDPSTLQSLIAWSIPRINQTKVRFFLEEILRRCMENLPSSRLLVDSLLSLHSDDLFFGWEYLNQNGVDLPLHLLQHARDDQLVSLHNSIGLVHLVEKSEKASLSPLYTRLCSLLPPSSLERDTPLPYSPLISNVLTSIDDDGMTRIIRELNDEDRLKCVEEWMRNEDSQSTIRLYRLMGQEERIEIERKLLSLDSSLQFLVNITQSSEFSVELESEVAVRVIKGYVSQSINETKGVYLSPGSRSVLHRLDVPFTLKLITDQVVKSRAPLKVSSFHSMATLFYDLMDNGMDLLDDYFFFSHIRSTISSLNEELSHYSLLSHYWPCSIDNLPYRPQSSSNILTLIEGLNKTLALFLALYVHRPHDSSSSILLIPIVIISSVISLSRSFPLSFLPQSETENQLLSYAHEMIESGGESVRGEDILSLLTHATTVSRPLLIYSLRPLTQWIRNGSLPCESTTPFSALPTQGLNLHLEMARQLYYRKNVDTVLQTILSYSQSDEAQSNSELFTLQCDEERFSLSISALTGANEHMRNGKELDESSLDFLRCAIVTAVNSVHSDCPSDSKWDDGRRRILAASAIQLGIIMNEKNSEMDVTDGSCLSRMLNLFISLIPSLKWDQSWNDNWNMTKTNMRYEMEMDQAGIPSSLQSLVVRASLVLEGERGERGERGEAILAAAAIIGMCACSTMSFSCQDEEKGTTVILPPFMKNLSDKDGFSRCGVLVACLSLISSIPKEEGEGGENRVERSVLCDAMAPLITKCLTTIVSKTEQQSDHIQSRFFIQKATPSPHYLLHWLSYLLRDTFSSFPSIVKMWYTALPKSASTLVNGFISSHLSSILIDHEITQVMEGNLPEKHKNDQATLTIRRYANEILLDYILEDTRMRLSINIPLGWPLLPPLVSVEGSVVGKADARKWILGLNSQLYRNSSVVSALSAWLIYAGKKVEGADSCTICMQLVAPQTKQLPKARCRTCHNKFHSSCLFKWFESSSSSSCPLCRTDFTAPP
ncbi:hypothetical protein PENTCL1PPCAC_22892 [Pristionchus entomophagus]|uniref:E3 ubiquitin-protein ligase listerin n=1 Tax=Pristionchus entomophagus TaxID=358040 RepID=A0AAV5U2J0_9BILA|nr:hypothetical protein PENTCL1PPCAC_22892 [Pristionchus entomophagus]